MGTRISSTALFGLVGIIVVLLSLWVGYQLGATNAATNSSTSTAQEKESYELFPYKATSLGENGCRSESCLYDTGNGSQSGSVEGFTRLKGFYTTYETTKAFSDSNDKVICQAFTILNNDNPFATDIVKMTKEGNGVNRLDNKDRLVLNINLDSLTEFQKNALLQSSETSPVELAMVAPFREGHGVNECYSFVDIVNVK